MHTDVKDVCANNNKITPCIKNKNQTLLLFELTCTVTAPELAFSWTDSLITPVSSGVKMG